MKRTNKKHYTNEELASLIASNHGADPFAYRRALQLLRRGVFTQSDVLELRGRVSL